MIVVHDLQQLEPARRAVAIGVFDGVHLGHRAVIGAAVDSDRRSTVLTFDPHPRVVLGYGVELLSSLERRIELIEECGVDEVLVAEFTPDLSRLTPSRVCAGCPRTGGRRDHSCGCRLSLRPRTWW